MKSLWTGPFVVLLILLSAMGIKVNTTTIGTYDDMVVAATAPMTDAQMVIDHQPIALPAAIAARSSPLEYSTLSSPATFAVHTFAGTTPPAIAARSSPTGSQSVAI